MVSRHSEMVVSPQHLINLGHQASRRKRSLREPRIIEARQSPRILVLSGFSTLPDFQPTEQ